MGMVNTFYLLVLMFSLYGISLKVTGDRKRSILASLIVSFYPGIVFFMRAYELQIGVIAFTTLSIYFLLLSDDFGNLRYSLLFSISFCFSMYMDRFTPIVFVVGSLIYVLIRAFKKLKVNFDRKIIVNMVISFLLVSFFLWPFYSQWIRVFILNKMSIGHGFGLGGYGGMDILREAVNYHYSLIFLLKRWLFYLIVFPVYHLGIFWSAVFLLGLGLFVRKGGNYRYLIFWWLIFPLIFFTFIPKKDYSYILPLLSPISLITSLGILDIQKKMTRGILITSALLIGAFFYILFMFDYPVAYKYLLLHTNYSNDFTIADIEYPFFTSSKKKNIYNNTFSFILNYFSTIQKNKSIGVMQSWNPPGVKDFEVATEILLNNPAFSVFCYSTGKFKAYSIYSKLDYLVFIKKPHGQETLSSEIKKWATSYHFTLNLSEDSFSQYELVAKRIVDGCYPVEIDIYKNLKPK